MTDLAYEYVDEHISTSLECPICRSPLVDPVMPLACQHLFCRTCLDRALDLAPTCPIDRTRIRDRRRELVEAPRVVQDLLGELRIRCDACREEMNRDAWNRHSLECLNKTDAETRQQVKGKGKAVHDQEQECNYTERSDDDNESELAPRDRSGSPSISTCRYCDQSLLSTSPAVHFLEACPLVTTPCPHASFGCVYVGPRETLSTDHLYSECAYEPLKESFERFREKEREWETENWTLKRQVQSLEQRLEDVEGILQGTKLSLGDYLAIPPTFEPGDKIVPLPDTLASLSSRNATLSASLSTLAQSHTESLHATQHLVDDMNNMRNVMGGMRMQMADLLRTIQILSSTHPSPFVLAPGGTNRSSSFRPGFDSRKSDSSCDEHEVDPDLYLSSPSSSDPEEDLPYLGYPPTSSRLDPMNRSSGIGPRYHPHPGIYGASVGPGGGGGMTGWNQGLAATQGPRLGRHPVGLARMNGRVVGGIGGGMKL
ncbi:uncharacterized protein JCM15063_001951 [Sporobolomyces koalae]|uniref:uncharacterized protein n=1 Tax=Sporobolomyces koalae TaxID=500713 RepID=UPI003174B2A7